MIKKKIIEFIKKNFPKKIVFFLIFLRDFPKKIKIFLPKILINFLIENIKDRHNKKIFTIRNFGGSTISRGFSLFKTDPEIPNWIDTFKPNSKFVDIGANIGIYSLYAASKNHSITAFEPESLNFSCLNLNIKDNNYNNIIKAYPICIHDKFTISNLNISSFKFGGSGSTFERHINQNGKNFLPIFEQGSISISFDEINKILNLNPNYIKIDVDGNELNVINGMKKTLSSETLLSICIELSPKFAEHNEVYDLLKLHFKEAKKFQPHGIQDNYNYIFNK
tara:strand:+ start:402 stop:1238 length:837 start_codon:yes stop_codon:yes gene_type:complete